MTVWPAMHFRLRCSSTSISFLWIVKKGVLDGKRKWTLTGENKKEAHTDREWLQQIFRLYDMDLKLSWAAWATTTVRQREHLSWICAAGELWHMFLFVLSFVLFFLLLRGSTSSKQSISSLRRGNNYPVSYLRNLGWECVAGTLKPLAYTRAG